MAGGLRPIKLLQNVRRDNAKKYFEFGDYLPGLYRRIGNVTFAIRPRRKKPHIPKFVLTKSIDTDVAQSIACLGPSNTVFTYEIFANAAIIPEFIDAASLDEILELRASWPFDPDHIRILAADVRDSLIH